MDHLHLLRRIEIENAISTVTVTLNDRVFHSHSLSPHNPPPHQEPASPPPYHHHKPDHPTINTSPRTSSYIQQHRIILTHATLNSQPSFYIPVIHAIYSPLFEKHIIQIPSPMTINDIQVQIGSRFRV